MSEVIERQETTVPAARPVRPAAAAKTAPNARVDGVLAVLVWAVRNWSWRISPVWAAALACGAMLCLTMPGFLARVTPWLAVVAGVAVVFGQVLMAALGARRRWPWLRLAVSVVASVWAVWALAASPWNAAVLITWALASAWVLWAVHDRRRRSEAADAVRPHAAASVEEAAKGLAAEWEARFRRVCNVAVRVSPQVRMWGTETGYTLDCVLPTGGTTLAGISRQVEALAADADLPAGCGVALRRGQSKARFEADVNTVNALAQTHKIGSNEPLSIENPFDIGKLVTSVLAMLCIRWWSTVIVAQTDAGKTTQLQTISTQIVRCHDALLWQIDLAGGGLALPWLAPFVESLDSNEPIRPAVDWVATTVEEAEVMLRAAVAIIDERKIAYRKRSLAANAGAVPIGSDLPLIAVMVDEFGTLPQNLRNLVIRITDTGRGAGVRPITCHLRATDTYLDVELKEQARNRIGLRVTDEKELAFLFGWGDRIDPDSAPYQGCGFLFQGEEGNTSLVPYKGYFTQPLDITTTARECAAWRPDLDEASAAVADRVLASGDAYRARWDRTLPLLFPDTPTEAAVSAADETEPRPGDPGYRSDISHLFEPRPGATMETELAAFGEAMEQLREHAETNPEAADQFAAIIAGYESTAAYPDGHPDAVAVPAPVATGADLVVSIIAEAGPDGIKTGDILAAYAARGGTEVRQTVSTWIAEAVKAGTVSQLRKGVYAAADSVTE